jgi:hypothetical protein
VAETSQIGDLRDQHQRPRPPTGLRPTLGRGVDETGGEERVVEVAAGREGSGHRRWLDSEASFGTHVLEGIRV